MRYSENKMEEFVALLAKHTPHNDINETGIPEFVTYKQTEPQGQKAVTYQAGIAILGQGRKACYLDGQKYDFSAGRYLSLFLPLPLEVEATNASPEEPLLMAGIKIDLLRIANILLKMDRIQPAVNLKPINPSAIISEPMNNAFLDPIVRLLRTLDSPLERTVLADPILDEIYFRLILNDRSGNLQRLLQHRGQIQEISKVVEHIHTHVDTAVSIDTLANMVNMSASSFRKAFREVMHMPPLQYAKFIKLNHAQTLIREGKNASEAGYMVGYNSPAQFSREYKRRFGYSPSAT
ncbi:MAG: AraC family transcriptional regulator [Anaerolineales bacterium]|nr:AraC family transcriptional regulator [Anaerolineales bacterium]